MGRRRRPGRGEISSPTLRCERTTCLSPRAQAPGTPGSEAAWAAQACGQAGVVTRRMASASPHVPASVTDTTTAEPWGAAVGEGTTSGLGAARASPPCLLQRASDRGLLGQRSAQGIPPHPVTVGAVCLWVCEWCPPACPSDTAVLRPPEGGACAPGPLFSGPHHTCQHARACAHAGAQYRASPQSTPDLPFKLQDQVRVPPLSSRSGAPRGGVLEGGDGDLTSRGCRS